MPFDVPPDQIGPVDVAVILFEGNEFNGEVAPALAELSDSGIVRIIDLAFVIKDADGTAAIVEVADLDESDVLDRMHGSQFDLLSDHDLEQVATDLAPETSALVLVWENTWAARVARAIRDSNGRLIAMERVPREIVLQAVAALDED